MSTSPFDADRPPRPARGSAEKSRWVRATEAPIQSQAQISADRPHSPEPVGPNPRPGRRHQPDDVMVPEAEFASYYGRNVIAPPPWGHDIPAYLFLGGLAAGSGLLAAGGRFTGRPGLRRRGRIAAVAGVALGGAALARDLGRPERFLSMLRTLKLTSPMSVGSWILAGFGACAAAALATEAAAGLVPPASRWGSVLAGADALAAAGSAFFAPPLAAYTAVLLSDTAVPTWHEGYRELPALFVSSALAAGSGLALVTAPPAETAPVRALAAVAAASDLVAGTLLGRRLGVSAEPLHEGRAGRLHAAARVLTAAGGVGAAVCGRSRVVAAASGVALLAGSACTRFAVFEAGMASARDPRYTVVPQRARADAAASEGRRVTQPGGEWPASG